MENNLPESWELVKLVEQLNFIPTGVNEFVGTKKYYSTGSIQENEFTPEGEFTYTSRPSRANRVGQLGDVLQARMKGTDKGIIVDEKLNGQLFSTGFLQVRPYSETYNNKLLYFLIKSDFFLSQKNELATGSTQEALTDNGASEIVIPLPPLAEQYRIVVKLNALMQKVEINKQRLVNIPKLLKRFRQSVLAAAVNGKLTEGWRNNNGIVGEWKEENLGSLTTLITSGSRGWAKYYSNSGSTFVRAQNISKDILDLSDIAFVKLPNATEGIRTLIKENDILVTITGANVTKTAHVDFKISDAYVSQHVGLVRVKNTVNSKFVYLFLISESHGRKQLLASAYGQGKPQLNLDNIKEVQILLPLIEEQNEIVRRVDQLFAFADKLDARYTKAKTMLDKLPQSILAKAFRGELTAQDPNDEPASALLEKIKKEKAKIEAERNGNNAGKPKKTVGNHKKYKDIITYIENSQRAVTQSEIIENVGVDIPTYLIQLNKLIDENIIKKTQIESQIYYELIK